MNDDWKPFRLKDICEQITDGKHGDCMNEPSSGYFFLSAKDLWNGRINYESARQITAADFAETHKRTKFEPSDILFTNSGTIGRMAIAKNEPRTHRTTFQKSVAILKANQRFVEPHFLYYLLLSENRRLSDFAAGTAQKNLLLKDLRDFRVSIPSRSIQCRMAEILSAYDDLIENNTRRIQILEEMTRRIYEEWFVRFRFPGHENIRMIRTELGLIPDGWETGSLSRLTTLKRVNINPSRFANEDFDHFSIPAFDDRRLPAVELGNMIRSNKYLVYSGHILMSKLNPRIQRVWLVPEGGNRRKIASTEFLVLEAAGKFDPVFIYSLCTSDMFYRQFATLAFGTSTSHQRVKPEDLNTLKVLIPSPTVAKNFSDIANPIFEHVQCLITKNLSLTKSRDLLLPKLISGEINVSNFPEPVSD